MKKIYLLLVLIFSSTIYSQTAGITYQAVILNPDGQNIPGYNNNRLPLSNKLVCLRFKILAGTTLEYQETMPTTTDEFGMINVIIGTGTPAGGTASTFSDIVWNGSPKSLVVEVDVNALCTNFIEISNQPFTAVPYALYSASSGTTGASGPQGPAGPTGAQGPQGVAGATGSQGPIGLNGPAGTQGPQGPQGVAGANGASGLQGANGLSAYQVAVANGFNGTETQWLTSIVGSQGPQGLQGVAGIAGQDGKNAVINTTVEPSGTNCPNGGTKIEVGLDINSNGLLDFSEINASQTKYVCNGNNSVTVSGSSNYFQVQELPVVPFSIAANGYYNPGGLPFNETKIYENLNSKEFDFNFITTAAPCFKIRLGFKFYDTNNNLVNVLYNDTENFQQGNPSVNVPYVVQPPSINMGNSNNPIFTTRNGDASGNINTIQRKIKFNCQSIVNKIEIVFDSTDVTTIPPPCGSCNCNLNYYNGTSSTITGFYSSNIEYKLFSFQ